MTKKIKIMVNFVIFGNAQNENVAGTFFILKIKSGFTRRETTRRGERELGWGSPVPIPVLHGNNKKDGTKGLNNDLIWSLSRAVRSR
jgi:hypothetical protein